MPFDPIELAEKTKEIVSWDHRRKYYRFRPAPFYGGISTADCVGCNLRCKFCWAWNIVTKPEKSGKFYSAEEVANKVILTAEEKGFKRIRVSGNEPTICREHLLELLEKIPENYEFILETNGILIGHDESYAEDLSKFNNVDVRVSLKGTTEQEFEKLSGANASAFKYQLQALENLLNHNVSTHAALAPLARENEKALEEKLAAIDPRLPAELEYEELLLYPSVKQRINEL